MSGVSGDISSEEVLVKVIFDYSYFSTYDEKTLTFKAGEEYYLVAKTSENWWYVKKDSSDVAGVYVPAQYVEEMQLAKNQSHIPPSSAPVFNVKPKLEVPIKPATSEENMKPFLSDGAIEELNVILDSLKVPEEFQDSLQSGDDAAKRNEGSTLRGEADETKPPPGVVASCDTRTGESPKLESSAGKQTREEAKGESETSDYKTDSRESLDSEGRGFGDEAEVEGQIEVTSFCGSCPSYRTSTIGREARTENPSKEPSIRGALGSDSINDYANLEDIQKAIQDSLRCKTLPGKGPPLADNLLPRGYCKPYQDQVSRRGDSMKVIPGMVAGSVGSKVARRSEISGMGFPKFSSVVNLQSPTTPPAGGSRASLASPDLSPRIPEENPDVSVLSTATKNFLEPKMVDKQGLLQKAKVEEFKKKLKKGWSQSYVVLFQNLLYFYKDMKPSAAAKPRSINSMGKPEFIVDLKGAKVCSAPEDKNVKKDAFMLITTAKTHYIFFHENQDNNLHWRQSIENNILVLESGRIPEAPGSLGAGKSESSSNADADDSKQTIAEKLKKFLLRRPSKESIKRKGIYKEVTFGSSLISICEREKGKVPRFAKECVLAIEAKGLETDGLYRVNANVSSVQKLRGMVDHNEYYNLNETSWDVHTITGALKLFFRELSEPLFTFKLYKPFLASLNNLDAVKNLVKQLPAAHSKTMKLLFRHINVVLQHSKENRMTVQGLAIVFGPTLMWPENTTKETNLALDMVQQGQLVEFIINNTRAIFG